MDTEVSLGHYWSIVKRRWKPASISFISTAAVIWLWGFSQTPIYEAEGKLGFKGQDSTTALIGVGDELGQLKSLDIEENPIATEIGIMRTLPIIKQTIEELQLKDKNGELIEYKEFFNNLEINHEQGTDILRVAYRSPDLEEAVLVVDKLIAVYLEKHLLANRAEASAARLFIEQQLPEAEKKARKAEADLRSFKEQNNIIALEKEAVTTVESFSNLQSKITDVSAELADVSSQFETVKARLKLKPEEALIAIAVSQSKGVQQVLNAYQQVQLKLITERIKFNEQHPVIVNLKAKQANLDTQLRQQITSVIGSQTLSSDLNLSNLNLEVGEVEAELISDYIRLDAKLQGLTEQALRLQQALASYQERAEVLPQLEQLQGELKRRLNKAQSAYSLLLERLQEIQLAENQNVGNVRVLQPAEGLKEPVAPRKILYLITGIMFGSLTTFLTLLILELSDRSIKTVEETKATLDFPLLGVIPTFALEAKTNHFPNESVAKQIPSLILCARKPSIASESYYLLGNNLLFLNLSSVSKVIAITSSVQKEGKSMVASNLAISLAQAGKKVLLVDGNIPNPMQHWVWNIPNYRGLCNILLQQVSVAEAVVETMPHLFVLPAGVAASNPVALLGSDRMIELLLDFKAEYDIILFDTSALINGASSTILGKMTDGILLVVRPEIASTASLNYAGSLIEQSQLNVLGVVVNGTVSRYESYNQYSSEELRVSHSTEYLDATRALEGK